MDFSSPDPEALRRAPLTTIVASFALRKILRTYLRKQETNFVAVLVIPNVESMFVYRDAAELLIYNEIEPEKFDRSAYSVSVLYDYKEATNQVFWNMLRKVRRSIVLIGTTKGLPPSVGLAADMIEQIIGPTPDHFLAAARYIGIKNMTSTDAEYLCTLDFPTIELAFRKGRPVQNAMRRLRANVIETKLVEDRATVKPGAADTSAQTLADVHGYGEAREWGLELAADVAEWRNGTIAWADIDSGALISGPPGCGKTTFASALAASCGMELVVASAARWQAKGHLGDYLKAMRASFDMARKRAPAILFLDEFDSFGDRESPGDDEHRDYKRQAINGLLECLDGADGKEGVVVVGATNNPAAIDPALLRPGRLETHLRIPMPDEKARLAILKQHLGVAAMPGDFSVFVAISRGWTGAMIQKLAKDAKRLARRSKRPLDALTVIEAMPELRTLSDHEFEVTAAHEAGHALIGSLLPPFVLEEVYVERRLVDTGGRQTVGEAVFSEVDGLVKTAQFYHDRIAMFFGGLAAEQIMFGMRSDGGGGLRLSDLSMATDIATMVERQLGLGETLSVDFGKGSRPLEELRMNDPDLRQRVEETLQREFNRALDILKRHSDTLETIASMLMQRGRVGGEEVRTLIGIADRLDQNALATDDAIQTLRNV